MKKPIDNEVVVKFQSPLRKITMYFEQKEDGLDMSMAMDPEMKEDEEPDLCMLLASTLLSTLQAENKEDDSIKVYDGTN